MATPKINLKKLDDEDRDKFFITATSKITVMVKELTQFFPEAHVLVIVFSPSGDPLLFLGEFSDLTSMVEKFASTTTRDKESRRLHCIETLESNYNRTKYMIDVEGLKNEWIQRKSESMIKNLHELEGTLIDLNNKRRAIKNPKQITSLEQLKEIEAKLQNSLDVVQKRKIELNPPRMANNLASANPGVSFIPEWLIGDNHLAHAMMSTDQFEEALRSGQFTLL